MQAINLDLDYFNHPKTTRLIGLLGRGSEVLPIKLWCWCAKYHAESGLLTDYSTDEIESIVSWWGERGKFVEAMLKVGLMEKNELGFFVHDFTQINGHIAAFRERAQKAAEARWAKLRATKETPAGDASSNALSNASGMLEQCSNQLTNEPTNEKKEILVVDALKRDPTETNEALKAADFVLRLHPEEMERWTLGIKRLIAQENQGRPRNPFTWRETTGSFERDLRSLIYGSADEFKGKILYQALNVLKQKLNWPEYVEQCIRMTIRTSERRKIAEPYKFVTWLLIRPNELISAKSDGILAQTATA